MYHTFDPLCPGMEVHPTFHHLVRVAWPDTDLWWRQYHKVPHQYQEVPFDDCSVRFFCRDGDIVGFDRTPILRCLAKALSDSRIEEVLVPEFSSSTVRDLLLLLTSGAVGGREEEEVQEVIQLAKIMGVREIIFLGLT